MRIPYIWEITQSDLKKKELRVKVGRKVVTLTNIKRIKHMHETDAERITWVLRNVVRKYNTRIYTATVKETGKKIIIKFNPARDPEIAVLTMPPVLYANKKMSVEAYSSPPDLNDPTELRKAGREAAKHFVDALLIAGHLALDIKHYDVGSEGVYDALHGHPEGLNLALGKEWVKLLGKKELSLAQRMYLTSVAFLLNLRRLPKKDLVKELMKKHLRFIFQPNVPKEFREGFHEGVLKEIDQILSKDQKKSAADRVWEIMERKIRLHREIFGTEHPLIRTLRVKSTR